MPRSIPFHLAAIFAIVVAMPAAAQQVAGVLRVEGDVMISSGGDFVEARDRQPVFAGQRIQVGADGKATVEYAGDCRRTYDDPDVYTIPIACRDDDDKDDKDDNNGDDTTRRAVLKSVGTFVGTAAAFSAVVQLEGSSPVSE